MSEIYLGKLFMVKSCFPSEKILLNVDYFFHLLLIFLYRLKYHKKHDYLTHNSDLYSFIFYSFFHLSLICLCLFKYH